MVDRDFRGNSGVYNTADHSLFPLPPQKKQVRVLHAPNVKIIPKIHSVLVLLQSHFPLRIHSLFLKVGIISSLLSNYQTLLSKFYSFLILVKMVCIVLKYQ